MRQRLLGPYGRYLRRGDRIRNPHGTVWTFLCLSDPAAGAVQAVARCESDGSITAFEPEAFFGCRLEDAAPIDFPPDGDLS